MFFFSFEEIGFGSVTRPPLPSAVISPILSFPHYAWHITPSCLISVPHSSQLFFLALIISHSLPWSFIFCFSPCSFWQLYSCLAIIPDLVHFMFDKEVLSLLNLIGQYIGSNLLQKQWLLRFPPKLSSFIHLLGHNSSPACQGWCLHNSLVNEVEACHSAPLDVLVMKTQPRNLLNYQLCTNVKNYGLRCSLSYHSTFQIFLRFVQILAVRCHLW